MKPNSSNLKTDDYIYLIYCEIGNCKHWIKTCTDPEKYFKNYDTLLEYFRELVSYEGSYNFHSPFPHEEIQYYKASYNKLTQEFLFRAWDSCLNKAALRKTLAARKKIIQSFFYQMELYHSHFTVSTLKVLENFKTELVDLNSIQKKEAPPPQFDHTREKELKENVQSSSDATSMYYSILELMLFYYKYRNLDTTYVEYCKKLCRANIALLPKVDQESRSERGRPFIAHLPAFDKLYSIYYKQGDYKNALLVCQEHLNCPQRGNNDDAETTLIRKRIALCRKKCAQNGIVPYQPIA